MQNVLERKNMYLEGFQVVLNFLALYHRPPFWIYWYAYQKMIKKTPTFLSVSAKYRVLPDWFSKYQMRKKSNRLLLYSSWRRSPLPSVNKKHTLLYCKYGFGRRRRGAGSKYWRVIFYLFPIVEVCRHQISSIFKFLHQTSKMCFFIMPKL